jgi:hypothetical protein
VKGYISSAQQVFGKFDPCLRSVAAIRAVPTIISAYETFARIVVVKLNADARAH